MNTTKTLLTAMAICLTANAGAQVTERERPAEWEQLVEGGRYVDRFMPMPKGKLSANVWGAPEVRPRYVDNGIEDSGTSFWGGNIMLGDDGLYHIFVCGWPESVEKGHMYWPKSTVYHAVSRRLHGPFTVADTIGAGHNPEAYRLDDGRYVVYVIDGYYISASVNGPWQYGKFEFDARDRRIIEGLSNLTFARRQDGSRLMICRGGGTWVSRTGLTPWRQISDRRAYPDVDGRFEDPVVWRDSLQYHLIVNDWLGRIAYYERSLDGVNWVVEQGEAYVPGISRHADGHVEQWFKYERAKVYQDAEGRVVQMNFAVIDTLKHEDRGGDHHSSKNICIPVRKDLLTEVLNTQPIDHNTHAIQLLIKAEKGFDPVKDIDVESLRLGSYTEVNFGRGCRPVKWSRSGKDLIVTFDGKGSGITRDEFAPKLLGRDRRGGLLMSYARLPYVNYRPAILSAGRPVYDDGAHAWRVEVENFGLSASQPAQLYVTSNGVTVVSGTVPQLQPYESRTITIEGDNPLENPKLTGVRIEQDGRVLSRISF